MSASHDVGAIISKNMSKLQTESDKSVRKEAVRNETIKKYKTMDEVPAVMPAEDLATLYAYLQTDMMAQSQFQPDFLNDLQSFIMQKSSTDPAFMDEVQEFINKEMKGLQGKVPVGQPTLEVFKGEVDSNNEQTFVAVFVTCDEEGKVTMMDKVDFDIYLTMYTSPHDGASLADKFNVPAISIPAGADIEAFSTKCKVSDDEKAAIHVVGHFTAPQGMQPITLINPLNDVKEGGPARKPSDPKNEM